MQVTRSICSLSAGANREGEGRDFSVGIASHDHANTGPNPVVATMQSRPLFFAT